MSQIIRRTTATDARVFLAQHRLTQQALAEKLGVSKPSVNAWSNEVAKPPSYLWRALAHLGAELDATERQSTTPG